METNSIFIKNDAICRMKLRDIQQRTTSNCGSINQMETIPNRYFRKVWSLDRSWKSQVLLGTTETEWITDKMVFQITGLWLYIMTHIWENKYKSRYSLKERSSKSTRGQQGCTNT